jgi:hypothetical protein
MHKYIFIYIYEASLTLHAHTVTIVSDTLQLPLSAVEPRVVLRRSSSAAINRSSGSTGVRLASTDVASSSRAQMSAAAQVCIAYCAYDAAFYY